MKRKGEEGEDKCLWLKEACEKDEERGKREERGQIRGIERVHARRMRGGQMSGVERVHVRRMRGEEGRIDVCSKESDARRMREEEGRTNVCSREGAFEKDGRD